MTGAGDRGGGCWTEGCAETGKSAGTIVIVWAELCTFCGMETGHGKEGVMDARDEARNHCMEVFGRFMVDAFDAEAVVVFVMDRGEVVFHAGGSPDAVAAARMAVEAALADAVPGWGGTPKG